MATHAGEVPVNPGAEPGRDDSGLPPVDIEIPDDARELDRDVIAYRRERRAQRRRARLQRVLRPVRGHGAILPLIASCVALSMLAGAMLSVFTISPASAPVRGPGSASSGVAPSASAVSLPSGTVLVNGKPTQLDQLTGAVLALVPAGCKCDTALKQLTTQASRARVSVYFVGTTSAMTDVSPAGPHGRAGDGSGRRRRGQRAPLGIPAGWPDRGPGAGGHVHYCPPASHTGIPARGSAQHAERRPGHIGGDGPSARAEHQLTLTAHRP